MAATLESIAERLRQHPKLVIADDFEISLQRTQTRGIRYHNGKLGSSVEAQRLWVRLRVLHRKRGGNAVVFNPTVESLQSLVEAAFESANRTAVDPWFRFPLWKPLCSQPTVEDVEFDYPSLGLDLPSQVAVLDESYEGQITETYLRRKTEKIDLRHRKQIHSASFSLFCPARGECLFLREERANRGMLVDRAQSLHALMKAASDRARLVSKPSGRGRFPVVLAPRVAIRLLKTVSPWFVAEAVQTGRSAFADVANPPGFSKEITLVDHGNQESSPWSSPFDLEGVGTQRTVLLEKGDLKNFLHDVYSAARENRLSTGNHLKGPSELYPRAGPSTLYFEPGPLDLRGLLEKMGSGLFIDNLETFGPLTGRPDRVAFKGSGWRIAFGQCTDPLRDIVGEVNLLSVFRGAVAVANDLTFSSGFGSPSILLEEMPLGC